MAVSVQNTAILGSELAINRDPKLGLDPKFTRVSLGPLAKADGRPKSCPGHIHFKYGCFGTKYRHSRLRIGYKSRSKAWIEPKIH